MQHTAFANLTVGNMFMILVGLLVIYLAISKEYNPTLLIPIGFGILVGNIALHTGLQIGINEKGSVLNFLFSGVLMGVYPSLIFLALGAMTDFSSIIANPRLLLIGIAAQFGIFGAYAIAANFGFTPAESGVIGIIGSADGPSAIFVAARLAPQLIGAIALSAYIYLAFASVIQPPFMKLLTTSKERAIRMNPPRSVSQQEKIVFPIIGLLLTCFLVPSALPLLGMLFFGNLLKESMVTKRLTETVKGPMIDIITILLGLTIGASTEASTFLTQKTIYIFVTGLISFILATIGGVLIVKLINLFLKKGDKINPLIGNAGVSAIPESAKVSQTLGLKYDKTNHLLMHAMGPNATAVIGSALAAGIMLSFLS